MNTLFSLPIEDLEYIYIRLSSVWENLRNKKVLITGGTGFFGIWFLESFMYANSKSKLNAEAYIITRNVEEIAKKFPHLKDAKELKFCTGDIKTFVFPDIEVDFIIHAASGGSLMLNDNLTGSLVVNSIDGTRHVLDYAKDCSNVTVLFTSSGAVYGKQPNNLTHVAEDYSGAPDTMNTLSTYGESKRICELLCALYGNQYNLKIKIARCYTFIGPYLPLQSNYAIGNFIYNALKSEEISIMGDGTPRRSYLYCSDLMVWLWTVLINGKSLYPYNIGSPDHFSIKEIAERVRDLVYPSLKIKVWKVNNSSEIERYVPSVDRAMSDLDLKKEVSLDDAILKTVRWYKNRI